jgi:hypothetical protein
MLYKLRAQLITQQDDVIEKNIYEQIFIVDLLKKDRQNAIVYNKELNMYFENSSREYIYEIELKNIRLSLCPRLQKSADFNRKLFYRYDWVQPKIGGRGNIVSIENKDELKQRWGKLKNKILVDYKGKQVEDYVNKIDLEFSSDTVVHSSFAQYLQFGLLFPNIPLKHKNDWVRKRAIEFSPYEEETFEECFTYKSSKDGIMYYEIEGNCFPDSSTQVKQYSGFVTRKEGDLFPLKVEINTTIQKEYITSQWNFNLYKI